MQSKNLLFELIHFSLDYIFDSDQLLSSVHKNLLEDIRHNIVFHKIYTYKSKKREIDHCAREENEIQLTESKLKHPQRHMLMIAACYTHSHLSVLLIKTEEKMCQRTNLSLSFLFLLHNIDKICP